jgi:hypothetical protein
LCCLFFDKRILVTPLVSSNFSCWLMDDLFWFVDLESCTYVHVCVIFASEVGNCKSQKNKQYNCQTKRWTRLTLQQILQTQNTKVRRNLNINTVHKDISYSLTIPYYLESLNVHNGYCVLVNQFIIFVGLYLDINKVVQLRSKTYDIGDDFDFPKV